MRRTIHPDNLPLFIAHVLCTGVIIMASLLSHPSHAATPTSEDAGTFFPHAEGSNLDGREFNLPQDFEGELNLVFIAFQREQQTLVDTWVPLAKTLANRHPGLRYYELPTIYRANGLVRWFINSGMRRGIHDPTARETTITLYLDKQRFRSALGIPHENTIYVLLVGADGRVIWRTEGAMTGETAKAVEELVSSELAKTSPVR
jgi:hypothetical protein